MSTMDLAVVLRLVDQLSGPAKSAAASVRRLTDDVRKLNQIGGAGKFVAELREAGAATRALQADVRSFASAFRNAAQSARGLSREMSAGSGRSRIRQDVRDLERMVKLQAQVVRGSSHGAHNLLAGVGIGYGSHRAGRAGLTALGKGGSLQDEMTALELLGIDTKIIDRVVKEARDTSHLIPQSTTAEALHSFRELRYAFADTGHAVETMTEMARFGATLAKSVGADKAMQIRSQVYEAVKSAELKNQIKGPAEFKAWLDMLQRIATVSGGIVTPAAMFQALKFSRGAVHGYDREFTSLFLPEIVQELATGRGSGGGRGGAGTSLAAFKRMFVDQTFALKHARELAKIGVLDESKITWGKSGQAKAIAPGALIGQDLATRNPFRWIEQHFVPKLKAQGVNIEDHAAVVQAVSRMGGTELMKQLVQLMVIQRKQMNARADMTAKALGVDQSYSRLVENYSSSLDAMKKQFDDMTAHLTLPLLKPATDALKSLTTFFQNVKDMTTGGGSTGLLGPGALAASAGASVLLMRSLLARGLAGGVAGGGLGMLVGGPTGAVVGSMLGGKLLGGGLGNAGLIGAASALNGSAVALTAAAARLAGGSVAGAVGSVAGAGGIGAWAKKLGAIPFLGAGAGVAGATLAAGAAIEGIRSVVDDAGYAGKTIKERLESHGGGSAKEAQRRAWNEDRARLGIDPIGWATRPTQPPQSIDNSKHTNVHVGGVTITVSGAGDPKTVADAVRREFSAAVERQLSDGAYGP